MASHIRLSAAAFAMALFATLLLAGPASAWTDAENRISYVNTVNGVSQVFTMRPDGRDPRQVTTGGPSKKCDPAFSPDGSEIAFAANDGHVYVVAATGGAAVDIYAEGVDAEGVRRPTWSPDGNTIVFHVTRGWQNGTATSGVTANLFLVQRTSKGAAWGPATPITDFAAGEALHARYSPDGASLVYSFSPTGVAADYDLWVMPAPVPGAAPAQSPPGSQVTHGARALYASWSPSGTQLSYVTSCSGGLFTMPVAVKDGAAVGGTSKKVIASGVCSATWATRSETQIAYESGGRLYKLDLGTRSKSTVLRAGQQPGW